MVKKYDLIGKRSGKLLVVGEVPPDKRPTKNHGKYWYCDCDCGTKNVMVPTTYLTGNSNYTQTSCGCIRKLKAFIKTTDRNVVRESFAEKFDDFEKYLFIHKAIIRATYKPLHEYSVEEYEKTVEYFYNDRQFNLVYNFWNKNKNKDKTFYDWAKPSLDHKVPHSRDGEQSIDNWHFITVFENLNKRDMTWEEWQAFKKETNTCSNYYIEEIMRGEEVYYG